MIKYKNHLGTIGISTAYLRQLISNTAESCFGVAGLNVYGAKQGVNVGAIVESIIHKVTYVLQEQAGVSVKSVNVFIDEMIN